VVSAYLVGTGFPHEKPQFSTGGTEQLSAFRERLLDRSSQRAGSFLSEFASCLTVGGY